jgi:acetyltransferase-like isoleucine patch superfamily enzyme
MQILNGIRKILLYRDKVKYNANLDIDASVHYAPGRIHLQSNCRLTIGAGSIIEGHLFFEKEAAQITIGKSTYIGASSLMSTTKIEIGDDVLVSFGVTIADHDSHSLDFALRREDVALWYEKKKKWDNVITRPVKIGNRAWIGMHAIILKGVSVGEGAVIGAGSVVTRNIPAWTLAAGNPARVIRELRREDALTLKGGNDHVPLL